MKIRLGDLKRVIREEREYAQALKVLFNRTQNVLEGPQAAPTKGQQARGADSYDRTR